MTTELPPRDDVTPTEPEAELGARALVECANAHGHALMFARYREAVLRPFVELHHDFAAMGDRRVASMLDDAIATARGAT